MKRLLPAEAQAEQTLFAVRRTTAAPISLTQRERDIFSLLEFNADESAANVAKKLRVSVASVHYTIRRLIDNHIIRPRCFINSCQLGFMDVGFYFSLSEQSTRARDNLIRRFKEHSNVVYIGSVLGDFQYVAVIMCRDLIHFSQLISELTGSSDSAISDKQIIPRLSFTRFPRKYISPRLSSYRSMALRVKGASVCLDDTDTKIVRALGNRPYESLRELARFLGFPLATVDRRVRKLREQGVIQGLFYDLSVDKIGVQSFRVLLSVQGLSCSIRKEISRVSANHPLITYLIEALGSWDFEVGIETFDARLVSGVVEELYARSEGKISGVRVLMEMEDFMCRHYPGKLGCGAPRV